VVVQYAGSIDSRSLGMHLVLQKLGGLASSDCTCMLTNAPMQGSTQSDDGIQSDVSHKRARHREG